MRRALLLVLAAFILPSCGEDSPPLTAAEIERTIDSLPYEFELEAIEIDGADAAYRGRATDAAGYFANFAVSTCDEEREHQGGCPLPSLPALELGNSASHSGWSIKVDHGPPGAQPAKGTSPTTIAVTIEAALCDAGGEADTCFFGSE